jgi:hypothetical protein
MNSDFLWKPPDNYEEVNRQSAGKTVFAPVRKNSDIREKVKILNVLMRSIYKI